MLHKTVHFHASVNTVKVHGKTRRGRPPKYQQYWIALAMEKAAQRALENGKVQNSEVANAGTESLPALKDDITTKETRLQQQENNAAANRTENKGSDQPPLKRRCNSWPLNENGKDGIDGSTSQGNPLPMRRTLHRNNSCSGGRGAESREDFMIVKKFKPNDCVQSSDQFKSSNAPHSTWNDKLFSGEVPFLVSSPYRQVTNGIIVPTSEPKSPFEGQFASNKGGNFFPRATLNSAGFVSESINGGFYDSLPDCGQQVQFVVAAEKNDYALDLSSKLLLTGNNREDNAKHAVSGEYVSVEKQVQLNAAAPQENRQLLNIVQPWNSGQLPDEMQAWNADKMMPLEQERKGYSTQPMLRAFPCSRLAEVSMWSVEEVVRFVAMTPGCHEYAECFRDEDIDGSSLLQLSESHLRNIIRMKLGPSLHLKKALDDLASFSSNSTA